MKLWLDDVRTEPPGYDIRVLTATAAINALRHCPIDEVSLDHDLGPDEAGTGYQVACWIEKAAFDGTLARLKWHIHSDNVVGREKMLWALTNADRHWLENEMAEEQPRC